MGVPADDGARERGVADVDLSGSPAWVFVGREIFARGGGSGATSFGQSHPQVHVAGVAFFGPTAGLSGECAGVFTDAAV